MQFKVSTVVFSAMLIGLALLTACNRETNEGVQIAQQYPGAEPKKPVPVLVPQLPAVDPTKCKSGDSKDIYWAAGDKVFRFKFDPNEPLHPLPDKNEWGNVQVSGGEDVPAAPMPSEPLGCYGNPDIKTPNIDRLAREGMLFENCYSSNAVCSPTRATLLTGLIPSQHGVHSYLTAGAAQIGPHAYSTIAEFRTPMAQQVLEAGLNDDDAAVRIACCRAFGRRAENGGRCWD